MTKPKKITTMYGFTDETKRLVLRAIEDAIHALQIVRNEDSNLPAVMRFAAARQDEYLTLYSALGNAKPGDTV